jgi:TonB family protein
MIFTLLTYQLQTALILMVLIGIYDMLFRKSGSLIFNRNYLYFILLFSISIPLIHISAPTSEHVIYYGEIEEVSINGLSTVNRLFNPRLIIILTYFIGVFIRITMLVKGLVQINKLKNQSQKSTYNNITIFHHNKEFSPFSFFNAIFINHEKMSEEEYKVVIQHETVHTKQKHSFDTILIEILLILFWFNPSFWFIRKRFKELHEFMADRGTVKQSGNIKQYTNILLAHSMGILVNEFTHSFSYSLNKNRITMMTKTISTSKTVIKAAAMLPVMAVLLFFFCLSPKQMIAQSDTNSEKAMQYEEVDKQPEFPGGEQALMTYLATNCKYPDEAKKKGISGKVFVAYEINKKGKVENVEVKRGANPLLDAEAVRVVSSMPDWTPAEANGKKVRVEMVVPINFKLDDKK